MFRSVTVLPFGLCFVALSTSSAQEINFELINGPAGDASVSFTMGEPAIEAGGGLISGQRTALADGSEFFLFSQSALAGNSVAEDAHSPSRYTFSGLQLLDRDGRPASSALGQAHGYFTIDGVPQPMSDPFGRGFSFEPLPSDPSIVAAIVPYRGVRGSNGDWSFTVATDVGLSGMGWTGSAPGSQAAMAFGSTEVGLFDVYGLTAVKNDINGAHAGINVRPTRQIADGDFDRDGQLSAADVDLLSAAVANGDIGFDLNNDGIVDREDLDFWVKDLKGTWFGDANMDGEFSSQDLVTIFQAGEYEDALIENSRWSTGDWNVDREFTSSDLVVAFQDGGYEQGPRRAIAAVPEPSALCLIVCGFVGLGRHIRQSQIRK